MIQAQPDTLGSQNTVFPQIHAHLKGMVSEFIFKIFQDQNSNFWFCTNHDGIIRYDGKKLLKYTQKSGLGGSAVRSFAIDKTGTIWLGTSGGLTKFDGRFFTNFVLGENAGDNEIWTLAVDKENKIWVGTNNGVYTFDGVKSSSFNLPKANIPDAVPMLSQARIGQIFIDSKGHKWFITDGYGITKFDGKNFDFLTSNSGLTDNNVTSIFEDSKGNIWIGTFKGGVSKYDGQQYTNFTKDGFTKGIEVSNFCEDHQGNIWFSTEGLGAYKCDGKKFTLYTTKDGLTTNTIQHIYADKKGQIWFCTWQGISLYDGNFFRDVSEKEPWTK
jgi:ligand-binding sensor domain-containing protein